jgi:hypothetical protein
MAVARFNLYGQSLLLLLTEKTSIRYRATELAALVGYFTWALALVFCVPGWWRRAAFILLSHAVAGVLHVQVRRGDE